MLDVIKNNFHLLPDTPGIYLFYDTKGELIYVGKASSLRNRVRSYWKGQFNTPLLSRRGEGEVQSGTQFAAIKSTPTRPIEQLLHEVADIRWKQTDSALEAAILEANYIKEYLPKYNVIGKDDKSWNYIVITKDIYPRIITIREHELKQTRYDQKSEIGNWKSGNYSHLFGPYPGMNTKATMKILRRLFGFSTCQPPRSVSVRGVTSDRATARELVATVGRAPLGSRVTPPGGRPCFYYQMGECLGVCTGEISPSEYKKKVINPLVLFLRGKKKVLVKNLEFRMRKLAKAHDFEEAARVRDQIKRLQHIHDIAMLNKSFFDDNIFQIPDSPALSGIPPAGGGIFQIHRIEGYDISNLGPTGVVGSMVVFVDGAPDKSQYRKFKIRTFSGQSDVDALSEVLTRRLRHAEVISQKSKVISRDYWPLPDLILVDGGKPQVNVAERILREHKLSIPVVGIAKGPERKRNDIVLGNGPDAPVGISPAGSKKRKKEKGSDELRPQPKFVQQRKYFIRWVYVNTRLLIAVRDEAHRFAIAYQRKLRKI